MSLDSVCSVTFWTETLRGERGGEGMTIEKFTVYALMKRNSSPQDVSGKLHTEEKILRTFNQG